MLALLLLTACISDTFQEQWLARLDELQDSDFDGYNSDKGDCGPHDRTIFPGATELCDGLDNDCDRLIDEGAAHSIWYADVDGDGFGDEGNVLETCLPPVGWVENAVDCDDDDATIYPGAVEFCDGVDQDCDGVTDDNAADALSWYVDADGDGYGGETTTAACEQPSNTTATHDDCDDTRADVHPYAEETDCWSQIDYNCDGSILYADADGDGYVSCEDCNDADSAIHPGALEFCDPEDDDEDCDGTAENTTLNASVFARDADGDGYGDPTDKVADCDAPAGYVTDATDCDDTRSDIHPDAAESDCADPTDYNCDGTVAYVDADADGFAACEDCNDADATISPAAAEVCDGADNDCDGSTDIGATDALIWYADADADGLGDPSTTAASCAQPEGYIADHTDCDDTDAGVGAATRWFADDDSDDFGDSAVSTTACTQPAGYVADATDCDDTDPSIAPDAYEICDVANVDEDCDGLADDDDPNTLGQQDVYADTDGDGYGDAATVTGFCDVPSGFTEDNEDCDDTSAAISPDATEVCDDIDQDCDGTADEGATDAPVWYQDTDSDGWGNVTTYTACDAPAGYVGVGGDCDDTRPAVFPGSPESCNSLDDDCDGSVDDGVTLTWYRDVDGDGYGGSSSYNACTAPALYVGNSDDCDDNDVSISPAEAEVCGDEQDNDCDGSDNGCRPEGALTAGGTISGDMGDRTGAMVSGSGDVDGDGFGDVLVGSSYRNDRGEIQLFAGPVEGSVGLDSAISTVYGDTNTGFGERFIVSPDLNGDGVEEWLVSCHCTLSTAVEGAVYLIGAEAGMAGHANDVAWGVIEGVAAWGYLGSGLSAPGDMDGNGSPDVVVSAYYADEVGAVYVWSAITTGTISASSADLILTGEASLDLSYSDPTAMDSDGDGLGEYLINAARNDGNGTNAGAVYGATADRTGTVSLADADYKMVGEAEDYLGSFLRDAGDVNQDGLNDLWVGAVYSNLGTTDGGAAYLVLAPFTSGEILSLSHARVIGYTANSALGAGAVGDIDQDGTHDLALGLSYDDTIASTAGVVRLLYGPFEGSIAAEDADAWVYGTTTFNYFGDDLDLADLNSDGLLDLIVGAPASTDDIGTVSIFSLTLGN